VERHPIPDRETSGLRATSCSGGAGSDLLEGRGNNDIIDGDHALTVRISVRTDPANPATETGTTDLMEHTATSGTFGAGTIGMTLQQAVFASLVDPGNLVAVREITGMGTTPNRATPSDCGTPSPVNCDTALFSKTADQYVVTNNADGSTTVADIAAATLFAKGDGIDTLWNIENLQFADTVTPVAPTAVSAIGGVGEATVSWTPPQRNNVPMVVTSYNVEVTNAVTNAFVKTVTTTDGAATSLVVPTLAAGNYSFRVQAVKAAATPAAGPFSVPATATVTNPALPGAPTILSVVAGSGSPPQTGPRRHPLPPGSWPGPGT